MAKYVDADKLPVKQISIGGPMMPRFVGVVYADDIAAAPRRRRCAGGAVQGMLGRAGRWLYLRRKWFNARPSNIPAELLLLRRTERGTE